MIKRFSKDDPVKKMLINILEGFSVEDWLKMSDINENSQNQFPNAKIAADIKKSPLYKVL